MPSKENHLAQAQHNQKFLDALLTRDDWESYSDWIVTVAFYKAIHLVEALFASDSNFHSNSHDNRKQTLSKEKRYSKIFMHYRPLYSASIIARYICMNDDKFKDFNKFCPPDKVKSEFLSYHLASIEKSVTSLLS